MHILNCHYEAQQTRIFEKIALAHTTRRRCVSRVYARSGENGPSQRPINNIKEKL